MSTDFWDYMTLTRGIIQNTDDGTNVRGLNFYRIIGNIYGGIYGRFRYISSQQLNLILNHGNGARKWFIIMLKTCLETTIIFVKKPKNRKSCTLCSKASKRFSSCLNAEIFFLLDLPTPKECDSNVKEVEYIHLASAWPQRKRNKKMTGIWTRPFDQTVQETVTLNLAISLFLLFLTLSFSPPLSSLSLSLSFTLSLHLRVRVCVVCECICLLVCMRVCVSEISDITRNITVQDKYE